MYQLKTKDVSIEILFKNNNFLFKELLEDDNIVKVGVAPLGDANYLARDYGVCVASTFDLRHMAVMCGYRPGGLSKLSENYLNVKLDKNWRIRCSDWEAPTLTSIQIDYAAKDAHVAIELFKMFANKLIPAPLIGDRVKHLEQIVNDYCFKFFDVHYNGAVAKCQKTEQNDTDSSSL